MKNNIPTILLRISLAILIASISLSVAKAALGDSYPFDRGNNYSDLVGKTCILQTGTEIIIGFTDKFVPVFIGNTYVVEVA